MKTKDLEIARNYLRRFLCADEIDICELEYEPLKYKGDILFEVFKADKNKYVIKACREKIPFSKVEKAIVKEFANALKILTSAFTSLKYAAHFRTALQASIMDITMARYLRADRYKSFGDIQCLIQVLKRLSYESYEGAPATSGIVVYRDIGIKKFISRSCKDISIRPLTPPHPVDDNLFSNPTSYRYVDGSRSAYLANLSAEITNVLLFDSLDKLTAIDKLNHVHYLQILKHSGERSFAAFVRSRTEVEVMTDESKYLIWRKGIWSLFDIDIFKGFLKDVLDNDSIESLAGVVYALSKIHHGTVILVVERGFDITQIKRGSVCGNNGLGKVLLEGVKGKCISALVKSGLLINILSSDGLTIFNELGELIDTGIIIDTSKALSNENGGGGRTTAASAVSCFGKVIKVSEDGPIDFYTEGKSVYKFG